MQGPSQADLEHHAKFHGPSEMATGISLHEELPGLVLIPLTSITITEAQVKVDLPKYSEY